MLASQQNAISDLIREKMAQGTPFRFRVISGSMAPLIAAGDEVVVERASAAWLRRGDIYQWAALFIPTACWPGAGTGARLFW